MNKKIDKEQNEAFLEILQNEEGLISKVDQKVLFITTDSWLAQLGSEKVVNYPFEKGTTFKSFLLL